MQYGDWDGTAPADGPVQHPSIEEALGLDAGR